DGAAVRLRLPGGRDRHAAGPAGAGTGLAGGGGHVRWDQPLPGRRGAVGLAGLIIGGCVVLAVFLSTCLPSAAPGSAADQGSSARLAVHRAAILGAAT